MYKDKLYFKLSYTDFFKFKVCRKKQKISLKIYK